MTHIGIYQDFFKKVFLNKVRKILFIFVISLIFTQEVNGDVPLLPLSYTIGFSFWSIMRTFGCGFLLIIIIEAVVLEIREKLGFKKAFKLSIFANIFSTFIGGAIFFAYSSSFLFFVFLIIGSFLFSAFLKSLSSATGIFQKISERRYLLIILFFIAGYFTLFLGSLTIPGHDYMQPKLHFSNQKEVFLSISVCILLFLMGFILTFLSEGFIITRYISKKSTTIILTILIMNIISYLALLGASGYFILDTIFERNWYWHS